MSCPVSYLMRALAIYEQQVGAEHPNTQTIQVNYTSLLEAMNRENATE